MKISDKLEKKCSKCGNIISFGEKDIIKYCSKCGTKYNKMRNGLSIPDYTDKMTEHLREIVGSLTLYLKTDMRTVGKGNRTFTIQKITNPTIIGSWDEIKVSLRFEIESLTVVVNTTSKGEPYRTEIRKNISNDIPCLEITDDELFAATSEQIIDKAVSKYTLWGKKISKEEYEKLFTELMLLNMQDAEVLYKDKRCKKD